MNKNLTAADLIAILSEVPPKTLVQLHGAGGDFSIASGTVIFGSASPDDRRLVSAPKFVQLNIDD